MSHDFHERLPGYSPGQVLYDGCAECESRASRADRGIGSLDAERFTRAWSRAHRWQTSGLTDISDAETGLLAVLGSVQIKLDTRGLDIDEFIAGDRP
jgi:hypothetical protein